MFKIFSWFLVILNIILLIFCLCVVSAVIYFTHEPVWIKILFILSEVALIVDFWQTLKYKY